jgi:glycosyltransferase involved in cell wall biosynthesis
LNKPPKNRRKVLTIINKDLETASTRFRVVQYLEFLKKNGIVVDFINRKAIDRKICGNAAGYDVVFNQKALFNIRYARHILASVPKTIFDFDDAIYTREKKPYYWITRFRVHQRLHLWLKKADIVTTANHFLANYARRFSRRVKVIPMALDTEVWKPSEQGEAKGHITMGWAGAPVNIPLIEELEDVFCHLSNKHPELKLAIFSGQKPRLSCPFDYYPYKPGQEVFFTQQLDIGLLPLTDEEFYRGKSPIKAIQYLACGVPVVGHVIGATHEILNHKNSLSASTPAQWVEAIERLVSDRSLRCTLGRQGREQVLLNHNVKLTAQDMLETIVLD